MSLVMMTLCLVAFESPMAGQAPVGYDAEDLDLLLLGTVLHDAGKPIAIIQVGKTGEQDLYRIGDVVASGRLTKILHDRVTLTFAETEVELDLAGGGAAAAATSATGGVQPPLRQTEQGFWRVERKNIDQLSRAPELIKQVTSLGAEGVRVDKVQTDDLFHKLGLQQGDIILSINARVPGSDVSMKQAIAHMGMSEPMLRLEIKRQGQMDVLYYEFDAPSSTLDSRSRQN
jgi:type II secretion system protein C